MVTKLDSRQTISRDQLIQLVNSTGIELDNILRSIDSELTIPFILRESSPTTNWVVNIGPIELTNSDTGRSRTVPPISNTLPAFTSGTVTLPATGAGNVIPSSGLQIPLGMTSSQFLKLGISIDANGDIVLQGGTPAASLALATAPPLILNTHATGFIVARTDGANNVEFVEATDIYQYVGGGGSGAVEPTEVTLTNDQSTLANITDFTMNSADNKGFSSELAIHRYHFDDGGNEDISFNTNVANHASSTVWIQQIKELSDGSFIIVGNFTGSANFVCKLNTDGTVDTAFNANISNNFNNVVKHVTILSDDSLLIGGDFTDFGVNNADYFCKLNADGTEDAAFNLNIAGNFVGSRTSVVVENEDGSLIVGGSFLNFGTNNADNLCKLNVDGTEDTAFNLNIAGNFSGSVYTIQILSDNSLIVGGSFLNFGTNNADNLCKLNVDGTEDTAFNLNIAGNFSSTVLFSYILEDSSILACGSFLNFGTNNADYACKVNVDGTEDAAFNLNIAGNFSSTVRAVVELPDNTIFVGGSFLNFGTNNADYACKLNADGTEDTTVNLNIGSNFTNAVYFLMNSSEDLMYAGGTFLNFGVSQADYVCEFLTSGIDSKPFNAHVASNFSTELQTVETLEDGSVISGGLFAGFGSHNAARVCKLNQDGTEDDIFNANIGISISGSVVATRELSDNSILIGGFFTNFGANNVDRFAKLNSDGTENTAFNANVGGSSFNNAIESIVQLSDGSILLGGRFTNFGVNNADYLCKLNSDGTEDATFNGNIGSNFSTDIYSVVELSDGSILVGGNFTNFGINTTQFLCKLNADGTENIAFSLNMGSNLSASVRSMAENSDGSIIVSGDFVNFGSSNADYLCKLKASGSEDLDFNSNIVANFSATINSVIVLGNGSLMVGGSFTSFGVSNVNQFARLNSDGTEDTTFNSTIDGTITGTVRSIASYGDYIYIGGNMGAYGTFSNTRLVQVQNDIVRNLRMQGSLRGYYDTHNTEWNIGEVDFIGDDTGIAFNMTDAGQLQYTSSDLDGTLQESFISYILNRL